MSDGYKYAKNSLDELLKLAEQSRDLNASNELSGFDYKTELFLAQARDIVIELVKRLRETEQQSGSTISKLTTELQESALSQYQARAALTWRAFTEYQRRLILEARPNYTTIGDWEQAQLKEARQLQAQGYLTLELLIKHVHAYEVNLTLKARELLAAAKI